MKATNGLDQLIRDYDYLPLPSDETIVMPRVPSRSIWLVMGEEHNGSAIYGAFTTQDAAYDEQAKLRCSDDVYEAVSVVRLKLIGD